MIGRTLAHYHVVEKLGAGGMGEVWRATDTKLGRDVAIKVLPPAFAQDPERLARFQREAHVLASLNHPNIAAIYGLEESEGAHYLVLELVPGANLAGPLPVDEALALARQITEALEEAHEKGIVHRDLKPANIKVTAEGKVKVLDFGLARFAAADWGSGTEQSPTLTRSQTIVGTAAYMSPEQARGKPVDKRSDIWAFGCVLYELLSGRQAFGAETISDSMVAILKNDPDWSRLPAETAPGIRLLLRRTLEKNPRQRLHDIADARIWIDEAGPAPRVTAPAERTAPRWTWAAGLLLLALLAAAGWWRAARTVAPPAWSGVQLHASTIAFAPRVSPDGQTLAFQAMVDGMTQVAVMKPESGNWTVLTRERSRGGVTDIAWSRDGTKLYFGRYIELPIGIFSVPVLGGEERLVLEAAGDPRVLPDGSLLASRINPERNSQLYRFWPETERLEALPAVTSPNLQYQPVRVFPDGKEAAIFGRPLDASGPDAAHQLYAIDLVSRRLRRLAPDLSLTQRDSTFPLAVTPDGRSVLIDLPAGDLHRIVAVPRDGSGARRTLLTLTEVPWYLDMAPDGSLYVDQVDRPAEVLRFSASGGAPERFPTPPVTNFRISARPFPDGRMLIPSRIAGRERLMVVAPGKDPVPLLDTEEESTVPAALVGDHEAAFILGTTPNQALAVASIAEGRIVRRLKGAQGATIDGLASSPDGKTLYYVSAGAIWAMPANDGEPRRIRAGDSLAVDPNGKDLVIKLNEKESSRLVRFPLAGGPERRIPISGDMRLSPNPLGPNAVGQDGRILVQVTARDTWFWPAAVLDPETGQVRRITTTNDADMPQPGWTSDGRIVTVGLSLKAGIWRFRPQ